MGTRKFIKETDQLSTLINQKANELHEQILKLNVDMLDMDPFCRNYFKECHSGRLIFSLRCSAHIIHDAVGLQTKRIEDCIFIDYGAGLGTLFMLAAKLPFKQVLYNDHLPEWCASAKVICDALSIPIGHFIRGDIDETILYCKSNDIGPDIIASRNVIEHIYDLEHFYSSIHKAFRYSLVYSTTTANLHNPAMHLKHVLLHAQMEKKYFINQRTELLKSKIPGIDQQALNKAVKLSRGKALHDFDVAVEEFKKTGNITPPPFLRSNTCDSTSGVWAEHILSRKEYKMIINRSGFTMQFKPGFWDINYKNPLANLFARTMNALIPVLGKNGILISPFVSVVAGPKLS